MSLSLTSTVRLNNGVEMPVFGLGTWKSKSGHEAYQSVLDALEIGYRHIDTASLYGNEESVGQAVRDSKIPREQIFITTKLWNDDIRSANVDGAMESSLKRLGMDQVDLYLIHWPVKGKFAAAYKGLEKLLQQGKARAIGVSNFLVNQLDELARHTKIPPAVNQVEWHPWVQNPGLLERSKKDGTVVEAWSPLIQGKITEIPEVAAIAKKHGKTAAQIALRWGLQRGVVMIPKSVKRSRIEENADIFDFELPDDDIQAINALDRDQRVGAHPDNFTF